jgi:hypothetical protein
MSVQRMPHNDGTISSMHQRRHCGRRRRHRRNRLPARVTTRAPALAPRRLALLALLLATMVPLLAASGGLLTRNSRCCRQRTMTTPCPVVS